MTGLSSVRRISGMIGIVGATKNEIGDILLIGLDSPVIGIVTGAVTTGPLIETLIIMEKIPRTDDVNVVADHAAIVTKMIFVRENADIEVEVGVTRKEIENSCMSDLRLPMENRLTKTTVKK